MQILSPAPKFGQLQQPVSQRKVAAPQPALTTDTVQFGASPYKLNWGPLAGKTITLQTPEEFQELPEGTVLYSIFGEKVVKGEDYIDQDTRFGHLAFGLLPAE